MAIVNRNPVVTLTVGNRVHHGWTSVDIELNLDALSGGFNLALAHRWLENGVVRGFDLQEGDPCALAVDGEPLVTGYLVDVEPSYAGADHRIGVQGVDKAGDLVDCSAPIKDWHGRTLDQIARDICAPFGIAVHCLTDTGAAFPKFAANPGDTCGATLERLLRQRGLWAWSDGLGGLNIGAPAAGAAVDTLQKGDCILSAQGKRSMAERFSAYTVLGQHNPGAGEDEDEDDDGEFPKRHPEGHAADAGVRRYRPLIIVAEAEGGGPSFAVRAAFEARVRRAKGHKPVATVQSWHTRDGALWRPGQTVNLDDDWLGMSGPWLIANVALSQNSHSGSTAKLTLSKPEAFDLLPQPERPKKKGSDNDEEDD